MAFAGVKVPEDLGRLIAGLDVPGEKETPSEYHITLCCFGDDWPIKKASKAMEIILDVVKDIEPFTIKADKISHFEPREGKPTPIIILVKSLELEKLHKKITKAFDKYNVKYNKTFKDFKPHITLAYSEGGHDDCRMDEIQFTVNSMVLWCGDSGDERLFITFPFKAPEKHAILLNKIDMFEKFALKL
jgi:2'-5' RNA ligase